MDTFELFIAFEFLSTALPPPNYVRLQSPYANTRSVAEMVLAELIILARQMGDRSMECHQGKWNKVSWFDLFSICFNSHFTCTHLHETFVFAFHSPLICVHIIYSNEWHDTA